MSYVFLDFFFSHNILNGKKATNARDHFLKKDDGSLLYIPYVTALWSHNPLELQPIGTTVHWSHDPLKLQLIGHTKVFNVTSRDWDCSALPDTAHVQEEYLQHTRTAFTIDITVTQWMSDR